MVYENNHDKFKSGGVCFEYVIPASKRLILFALIRQAEAKTNKKSAWRWKRKIRQTQISSSQILKNAKPESGLATCC
jgi:hypothetical protein